MDEVPTQAPDFVVPLSIAFDSDLTAKLSPALRAARVKAVCPSKAAVRALNLCGGVNPSNPPLPAMGFAPPAARQRFARSDSEGALPFAERREIEEYRAGTASHSSVNSSLLTPHSSLSFSLSF